MFEFFPQSRIDSVLVPCLLSRRASITTHPLQKSEARKLYNSTIVQGYSSHLQYNGRFGRGDMCMQAYACSRGFFPLTCRRRSGVTRCEIGRMSYPDKTSIILPSSLPLHRRLITRWTSTSLTETLRCSLSGAAKCAGSKTASSTSFASSQGCSSLASIFSSASHSELDTSTDVSQRICVLDALGISSSASATPEPWGVMGLLTEE